MHVLPVVAFVLKNYIPEKHKVILLHQTLGKITCIYSRRDQAARLCSGAKIVCIVEKKRDWYEIVQCDILFMPEQLSIVHLTFIHQIIVLCLKLLPANIVVGELFDFLSYVYSYFDKLTPYAQNIILLRLFLLFDVLPENKEMYHCAIRDPYAKIDISEQKLDGYVKTCWQRFNVEYKF